MGRTNWSVSRLSLVCLLCCYCDVTSGGVYRVYKEMNGVTVNARLGVARRRLASLQCRITEIASSCVEPTLRPADRSACHLAVGGVGSVDVDSAAGCWRTKLGPKEKHTCLVFNYSPYATRRRHSNVRCSFSAVSEQPKQAPKSIFTAPIARIVQLARQSPPRNVPLLLSCLRGSFGAL